MTVELPSVHPSLSEGLGMIVQRWAYVEALEGEFLAFLVGAKHGNLYAITQASSGKAITSWLRTLTEIKIAHEESRVKLICLFTRIDELRAERNALVHGLWSAAPEAQAATVQTVNLARSHLIITSVVTCPDLQHLLEDIGEVIDELILVGRNMGWYTPGAKLTLV